MIMIVEHGKQSQIIPDQNKSLSRSIDLYIDRHERNHELRPGQEPELGHGLVGAMSNEQKCSLKLSKA